MIKAFKNLLICLVAATLLLLASACHAEKIQLAILLPANHGYYQQSAETMTKALESQPSKLTFSIKTYTIDSLSSGEATLGHPDMLIAIGTMAVTYAITHTRKAPLLNILIPKQTYLDLTSKLSDTQLARTSAIYIDQPFSRIIALIQALPIQVKAVGAISSTKTADDARAFKQLLTQKGLQFNHATANNRQNPIQLLRPIFASSDVFIAMPDSATFNRAMAKWILNISFQSKVPVIGFSSAYASAGALTSIFSSPENVGQQAGELVIAHMEGAPLPDSKGVYAKYFSIQSNLIIARAMGIDPQAVDQQLLRSKVQDASHD